MLESSRRVGAEDRFGDKNSWIDLQTGAGVQRVPVRVKGKPFGLSIQKTDAWIIPETSDPAPHVVVAPVDEAIGRAEQPVPAPAAQEAAAPPRPKETQGMRDEAWLADRARELAEAQRVKALAVRRGPPFQHVEAFAVLCCCNPQQVGASAVLCYCIHSSRSGHQHIFAAVFSPGESISCLFMLFPLSR